MTGTARPGYNVLNTFTQPLDLAGQDNALYINGSLYIGDVLVGSTAAEIDLQCDVSAQTEAIAAAGAISVVKRISKLALVGAGAVTLAAPDASMLGMIKYISMTTDNGDVTLALTNVQGQSTGTTATFNDVGDTLGLMGGVSKWNVISEAGITLA